MEKGFGSLLEMQALPMVLTLIDLLQLQLLQQQQQQ
jgi:hypothetical protein